MDGLTVCPHCQTRVLVIDETCPACRRPVSGVDGEAAPPEEGKLPRSDQASPLFGDEAIPERWTVGQAIARGWTGMLRIPVHTLAVAAVFTATGVVSTPIILSLFSGTRPSLGGFILSACLIVFQSWLGLGYMRVVLDAFRGQRTTSDRIIAPIGQFMRVSVVGFVVMLIVAIGLICLVIPGLYFALAYSQVYYLIVDDRARLFDALARSFELTDGAKWRILGAVMVTVLLTMPAQIAARVLIRGGTADLVDRDLLFVASQFWQSLVACFGMCVAGAVYLLLTEPHDAQ
jgi:hypothetical protein